MIVLSANTEQYEALNGYSNEYAGLEFALDGSGRYVVGIQILTDPNFAEIHDQLNELERIEYTPPEEVL